MKKLLLAVLVLVVLALAYLLLAPVPIEPVAWTPPPKVPLTGLYAPNERLKGLQRFGVGVGTGPEGIAVDAVGRIYAGYDDGRIVLFAPNGNSYQELAESKGGRPLGLTFGPNGGLVVADAEKGLLAVGGGKTPRSLLTEAGGRALAFTDDVDNTRFDKNVYFTDASRLPKSQLRADFIEHRATGRLLRYDVAKGEAQVLIDGLHFANGVAVGPDDAYVLVNETAEFRIRRYWLKGDKAGTHEVFLDGLPGLPDNLSYDYDNNLFWVALYSPRVEALEDLADKPAWVKKMVARLPAWATPEPKPVSWVLGVSPDGKVLHNLYYAGENAYGPITSVEAWGPWLIVGSLTADSLARLPINQVIPGAKPPPPGWEQLDTTPHQFKPPKTEDEGEAGQQEERERGQPAAAAPAAPTTAPVTPPAP